MKKLLMLTIVMTLIIFLLPLLTMTEREPEQQLSNDQNTPSPTPTNAVEAAAPVITESPGVVHLDDSDVLVEVEIDGRVHSITMDRYLLGVMAAEMPPTFPLEALKAQAVAARTHTYNKILEADSGKGSHTDADVCSNPAHCKAYLDWDEVAAEWDGLGKNYVKKVTQAVESTSGEIMTYKGKPIVAVFHAASAEYTERAVDVWGTEVPYLQSVKSPATDTYEREVTISTADFKKKFLSEYDTAKLGDDPRSWFADITRSAAGSVKSVKIGGISVTGTSIRFLFDLASANFSVRVSGDQIVFSTSGYGHGVGMSQYGAEALALEGKSYTDILSYYYSGVTIERIH